MYCAALLCAAAALCVYLVAAGVVFASSLYSDANARNLERAAVLVARLLSTARLDLEEPAVALSTAPPLESGGGAYRMTLIRPDGLVVADSHGAAPLMENHGDREEVRAALAGRPGNARRRSATLGHDAL